LHKFFVGQEIFTKTLLSVIHHKPNVGAPNMKKTASRLVLSLSSLRKINFTKAEPNTMVIPALAQKSSDWMPLI